MIAKISDMPRNAIGFTASGKVTADEYESVLILAIEAKLEQQNKIRLLYQLDTDFSGYELVAMWDDAKIGFDHFAAWERIAVVTDVKWIRGAVKIFGFAMPGVVKVFKNDEQADAKDWLSI